MKRIIKNIKFFLKKVFYYIKLIQLKKNLPIIKNNLTTIKELINTDKSIIRFGDGEFIYLEGHSICFQDYDENLSKHLKKIFYNDNPQLLTGTVSVYYEFEKRLHKNVYEYILKWVPEFHHSTLKYYNYAKTYWSSFISIPYSQYKKYPFKKHYSLLKQIWNNKKITIITGDRVFNDIEYNIFDNAYKITYIFGPTTNAYNAYDKLKKQILYLPKDELLIFALGPCGKVLAYDAFKSGSRVLDLGHLIKDYDLYCKSKKISKKEVKERLMCFFGAD